MACFEDSFVIDAYRNDLDIVFKPLQLCMCPQYHLNTRLGLVWQTKFARPNPLIILKESCHFITLDYFVEEGLVHVINCINIRP